MLRAKPEDCPDLYRRRIELELLLMGTSIDYDRCVRLCKLALV